MNVSELDDATAIRILTAIARPRIGFTDRDITGLRAALEASFGVRDVPSRVDEGDLARQALAVLVSSPADRVAVSELVGQNPGSEQRFSYDMVSVPLALAAICALRTGVELHRTAAGKWTVDIIVKPAGDGVLKALVEKLISYLPA